MKPLEFIFKEFVVGIVVIYSMFKLLLKQSIIAFTLISTFIVIGMIIEYINPNIQYYIPILIKDVMLLIGFVLYILYRIVDIVKK